MNTISNCKNYFLLILVVVSFYGKVYPQSPLDSLEIYDPFSQGDEIRRIVAIRLSILSGENSYLINKYAEQIEHAKKTKSLSEETTALIKSGDIFFNSALYNIALDYYLQALEKFETVKDSNNAALVEIKIGRTYYFSDLVPLAKEYMVKAYRTLINSDDKEMIAIANYAMGTVEDNPKRASLHFKKALDIQEDIIKKKSEDYTARENLAKYLNANGRIEEALAIAEKINDKWLTVLYLNNLGYSKAFDKKYGEAITIFNRSLKISKAAKLKGLLKNTYVNLSVTYRLMEDWKRALRYKEIAAFMVESLYSEEFTIQISEIKVKYETKKKELENELLRKEQIILADNITDKTILNYFLIFSIIGISAFTFYTYYSRQKLKAANKLLDKQKNEIQRKNDNLEILHEALKKSEENLNIAQRTARIANWEWKLEDGKIFFSKELPHIYGIEEESLISDFRHVISNKIHPDDLVQLSGYFNENFSDMKNDVKEYRVLDNNQERWVRAKRVVITDENGKVTGVFGTVQDITESKNNEEAKILMASQNSFTRQLINSQEEERKRIAAELHDSLGQDILLIKNRSQLGLQTEQIDPFIKEQLEEINKSTSEMLDMVREIAFDLRPAHFERLGLTETILAMIKKVSLTTDINFTEEIDNLDDLFGNEKALNFYRIIQESISNIVKHSYAKNASIGIQRINSHILTEIHDDGKGFEFHDKVKNSNGFGLNNILNRVQLLNGNLTMGSNINGGAKLTINIPLDIHEQNA